MRRQANPEVLPMGYTVREIQPTPNPNAAKFVLDREISDRPISFLNPAEGSDHPLASQLFGIKGIKSILILGNSPRELTIAKSTFRPCLILFEELRSGQSGGFFSSTGAVVGSQSSA